MIVCFCQEITGLHFPERKNTRHDETPKSFSSQAYKYQCPLFFSFTEKMIVTQLVLAFCVGFSLAQEAPERKEAVELDGKDGAGPAGTE